MIYKTHLATTAALVSGGLYINQQIALAKHEIFPKYPLVQKSISYINDWFSQYIFHTDWDVHRSMPLLTSKIYIFSFILMACIGALMPDIDHPNSKVGRYLPKCITNAIPHRGPTHTIYAVMLLYFCSVWLMHLELATASRLMAAFALGYFCHIIEDKYSYESINLFWPIPMKKKYSVFRYKTGGKVESVIFYLSSTLFIVSLFHWLFGSNFVRFIA